MVITTQAVHATLSTAQVAIRLQPSASFEMRVFGRMRFSLFSANASALPQQTADQAS